MPKRDFIQTIILLVLGLATAFILNIFFFDFYQIKEVDANHYLMNGETVLVSKKAELKRGLFVLYQYDGQDHVGRILAKEKDSVTYMDDLLYLNNEIVDEAYLASMKDKFQTSSQNMGYFTSDFSLSSLVGAKGNTIPKDCYLVLNDDRQNLEDSRSFGLIAKKDIKGVIDFRISPLNRFGFIEEK